MIPRPILADYRLANLIPTNLAAIEYALANSDLTPGERALHERARPRAVWLDTIARVRRLSEAAEEGRLPALDTVDHVLAALDRADAWFDELEATIPSIALPTDRPATPDEEDRLARAEHDRRLIETGMMDTHEGSYTPGLDEALRHALGRAHLRRLREVVLTIRADVIDSAANPTGQYRFVGRRFQSQRGGRYLEPGEILTLTREEAKGMVNLVQRVE